MNRKQLKNLICECVLEVLQEQDYDSPEGFQSMRALHHKKVVSGLDYFTKEYIKAAFFSSTGPSPEDLEKRKQAQSGKPPEDKSLYHPDYDSDDFDIDDEEDVNDPEKELEEVPLENFYNISDINIETLEKMKKDCDDFYDKYSEYYHEHGWSDDQAAHDFWLTRNGHGAGFWSRTPDELDQELYQDKTDEEIEAAGDQLTKASKAYGEFNLYVGDDGQIYGG